MCIYIFRFCSKNKKKICVEKELKKIKIYAKHFNYEVSVLFCFLVVLLSGESQIYICSTTCMPCNGRASSISSIYIFVIKKINESFEGTCKSLLYIYYNLVPPLFAKYIFNLQLLSLHYVLKSLNKKKKKVIDHLNIIYQTLY